MKAPMTRPFLSFLFLIFCLSALPAGAKERKVYDESIESERNFDLIGGPSREGAEAEWALIQNAIQKNKLKRAIKHAGYLTKTWPDHPLAVDAQRIKADLLFAREDYQKAFEAYQALIDNYVGSFVYAEVLAQQLECARKTEHKVYHALFGLTNYTDPLEAVPLYRQLLTNAPHTREAPQILFDLGEIYFREGKQLEAIQEFQLLEQRYPDSPLSEHAALRIADAYAKLAKRNPTDVRPIEGELNSLNHFIAVYSESENLTDVRIRRKAVYEKMAELHFSLGKFYETAGRRPDAALVTYRSLLERFPDSEWTAPARERILALSQKVN
jgi:outer membrane protein assembly factor BamD (BamD/ComL family)